MQRRLQALRYRGTTRCSISMSSAICLPSTTGALSCGINTAAAMAEDDAGGGHQLEVALPGPLSTRRRQRLQPAALGGWRRGLRPAAGAASRRPTPHHQSTALQHAAQRAPAVPNEMTLAMATFSIVACVAGSANSKPVMKTATCGAACTCSRIVVCNANWNVQSVRQRCWSPSPLPQSTTLPRAARRAPAFKYIGLARNVFLSGCSATCWSANRHCCAVHTLKPASKQDRRRGQRFASAGTDDLHLTMGRQGQVFTLGGRKPAAALGGAWTTNAMVLPTQSNAQLPLTLPSESSRIPARWRRPRWPAAQSRQARCARPPPALLRRRGCQSQQRGCPAQAAPPASAPRADIFTTEPEQDPKAAVPKLLLLACRRGMMIDW